jgi:probable F420-dependent oxidoreductase
MSLPQPLRAQPPDAADRRIRFGVQLIEAPSGTEWTRLARRVETLGYSAISMPDHLWTQFAPIPALTAAALATTRPRITMAVLANDLRNPVMLAKEAATLDILSGGRLDLGMGAGWREEDYRQAGVAFDRPAVRIARLVEAVTIMRRLLEGEEVTFRGAYYDIDAYRLTPLPVQRPRPRLMLGGGAPRMLGVAARHADIVSISTDNRHRTGTGQYGNATLDAVERAVRVIAEAAPGRADELELNLRVLHVNVGADRPALAAASAAATGLAAEEVVRSPFCAVGTVRDIADHFCRVRDRLGVSYFTVSAAAAEALAPVVDLISGK